jgi:hypothetical protein
MALVALILASPPHFLPFHGTREPESGPRVFPSFQGPCARADAASTRPAYPERVPRPRTRCISLPITHNHGLVSLCFSGGMSLFSSPIRFISPAQLHLRNISRSALSPPPKTGSEKLSENHKNPGTPVSSDALRKAGQGENLQGNGAPIPHCPLLKSHSPDRSGWSKSLNKTRTPV